MSASATPVGPLTLPRLAAVRPSSLNLPIPAHAGTKRQVDPRRRVKAEALGNLGQVQLVDVEHGAQAVARVRVEVAPVPLLGALVKVVVLRDQFLELGLDIEHLLRGELVLDYGHTGLLEVPQK